MSRLPDHIRGEEEDQEMTEIKLSEPDMEWIERRVEQMVKDTPSSVLALYEAEGKDLRGIMRAHLTAERTAELRKKELERIAKEQREEAMRKAIEAEVIELYGINYFIYVRGERLPKIKHLSDAVRCECGQALNVTGDTVRELYDRRHRGLVPGGLKDELPFKIQLPMTCPKCHASCGYADFVVIA